MRKVCESALEKRDEKSAARGPGVRGIGGCGGGEGDWADIGRNELEKQRGAPSCVPVDHFRGNGDESTE